MRALLLTVFAATISTKGEATGNQNGVFKTILLQLEKQVVPSLAKKIADEYNYGTYEDTQHTLEDFTKSVLIAKSISSMLKTHGKQKRNQISVNEVKVLKDPPVYGTQRGKNVLDEIVQTPDDSNLYNALAESGEQPNFVSNGEETTDADRGGEETSDYDSRRTPQNNNLGLLKSQMKNDVILSKRG